MTVGMILIVLAVLMAIGLPVSIAVLVPSLLYLFIDEIPLSSAIGRMSGSVNSFTVMAVPFFIIAGQVMNNSGLTEKLVAFTRCLVGHMRGGFPFNAIFYPCGLGEEKDQPRSKPQWRTRDLGSGSRSF